MKIFELRVISDGTLVSDNKYPIVLAENENEAIETFRSAFNREYGRNFSGEIEAYEKSGVVLEGLIGW